MVRLLAVPSRVAILALLVCQPARGSAEVRLVIPDTDALPGERLTVPISLVGEADPGIISLSIRVSYAANWLELVDVEVSSWVQTQGFMVLSNLIEASTGDTIAIGLAGTQPLAGEGDLVELVFEVDSGVTRLRHTDLRFTPQTQANRGAPDVITAPGTVTVRTPAEPFDLDGNRTIGFDDFYYFFPV